MNKIYGILLMICTVAMMIGCAETKYVDEGQYLLNKTYIVSDTVHKNINISALKGYITQTGNSRWFSTIKIPLRTYSLSGRDTTKWINRTLRSMGEAPVIYDSVASLKSCKYLRQAMMNKGYLGAYATHQLINTKKKKTDCRYTLHPGKPYFLRNVEYDIRDSVIAAITANIRNLAPGQQFDVDKLDAERKLITKTLVNRGYYKFNKDFISFVADTVSGQQFVDLILVLHPYRTATGQNAQHPCYNVGSISYQSDNDRQHLRQTVLENNTFVRVGRPYSAQDLQNTYRHFARLQSVRYTDISFKERADSNVIDCNIRLNANKAHTLSFQPEGTNTAGDLGAAVSLTYQNRNMFRGSELLSVELRGAFEAIRGLEGYSNSDFEEYSVETKLLFPRFIAPFLSRSFKRRTIATSEVSMLYDLQNRPEYHRRVLSLAWKYKWNDPSHHDKYQVDLVDLNYVFMPWISDKFRKDYLEDASNRNAILRYNYEDLLIMKCGFGFVYNNGNHAVKVHLESAGNLLNALSKPLNFKTNSLNQYKVFNIAYAQYAKVDLEYTKNIKLDYNNTIVMHAALGIAYPYGNSTILPFEKRYFSGGANSLRGWSVRGIGPGRYSSKDGNIDFINQTGDMKLDLNVEYRAHLFWKLNGALFVDAGNIWTLRKYDDQPGGQFRFDTFWRQIAASYGLGFRFNFEYFILRFDMGMTAINPVVEEGDDHYPIIHPKFSRDFAFHFAVGLPF